MLCREVHPHCHQLCSVKIFLMEELHSLLFYIQVVFLRGSLEELCPVSQNSETLFLNSASQNNFFFTTLTQTKLISVNILQLVNTMYNWINNVGQTLVTALFRLCLYIDVKFIIVNYSQ